METGFEPTTELQEAHQFTPEVQALAQIPTGRVSRSGTRLQPVPGPAGLQWFGFQWEVPTSAEGVGRVT